MRIESSVGMEQRLSNPLRPPRQIPSNHSRKNKRRSSRRSNLLDTIQDTWPNTSQSNQDGGLVPGMEYPPRQMLWQPTDVQNVSGNGQRLFTAMSDPSVCGYSPMPMTYAMQPVSLPTMYRMYQPMPVPNIRTVHSRQRHHYNKHLANVRPNANSVVNGYGNLQENGVLESAVHMALRNGDYASLPPTANKDNGVNGDELNSEHRRYSDPGLGPAGPSTHSDSDDSDSVESGSSITTISRNNKLVLSLIEQMTELKKCNNQLFKELSEAKSNVENVKAKLAQCRHSTPADYQPGMLSELIREIREANRNCEEGLVTTVKSMLEEKCNQQAKEVNELKNQLAKILKEKEESDQRVAKLEEEMMALKLSATNEGREIAVFEEENLALRRELQEARASRTLAENHAAKCVNFAVSRSVTPVTFDTPCITSTPVRTALTDTRFLFPAIPLASHTFSISSVLRPRSAEVAVPPLVSEIANQCQNSTTDSEPVSCEDMSPTKESTSEMSLSCKSVETCTNNNMVEVWKTMKSLEHICEFLGTSVLSNFDQNEAHDVDTTRNDGKVKPSMTAEDEKRTKHLSTDISEKPVNQLFEICEAKVPSMEKDEAQDFISFKDLEEQKYLPEKMSDVTCEVEKLINYSDNHNCWQKRCRFHNQRGSFKKPRRKKENLRRLFSESDKDLRQDTMLSTDPLCSFESNCDTADEDEDYFPNDGRTSRTITDVPDVVVIGGSSIVPKDLCSTRTLISRTQTAPSRATYTTAYI
ncbi:hypothetical protein ALC56_02565 [Trachymyrmex septentrionalis]|uniref:Uncharacterized protein n=1 Tax=Trachymyrmex septentrionalis TaxID=34720 RepID=A0A195FQM1_9HYME|nr:PREDICTED: uncharacterized protein LOC108745537 [Trachymyrmex septentrionalis]XP_018337231.1 PREDICTED: uncharacterized protein LOC108745537 [Trachymyrmex septentrionalis]KYN42763.1 hypothetical protein ALC56_02565 [Trachymyrmex septentrionalis]